MSKLGGLLRWVRQESLGAGELERCVLRGLENFGAGSCGPRGAGHGPWVLGSVPNAICSLPTGSRGGSPEGGSVGNLPGAARGPGQMSSSPWLDHICPRPPPLPGQMCFPAPFAARRFPCSREREPVGNDSRYPVRHTRPGPACKLPIPSSLATPTPKLPTSSSLASPTSSSCGNHRCEGRTILRKHSFVNPRWLCA